MLQRINVKVPLNNNQSFEGNITYEVFGKPLGTAPIVLVNHALTGNSSVAGEKGWWKKLVGENKVVNTQKFTVLSFNVPGNGYDGELLQPNKYLTIKDTATIFLTAIKKLNISKIYIGIGGSIGGALIWQMAYLDPCLFDVIIPVATDYKASDWLIAQTYLQKRIIENSSTPLRDARIHAMLLYRTPNSLNERFRLSFNKSKNKYEVQDWLDYHGNALEERFELRAYTIMNHLLGTINVASEPKDLVKIKSEIHIISVDSDLFFVPESSRAVYKELKGVKDNIFYNEIISPHGHDAFLIEYEQMEKLLKPIFDK